MQNSCNINYNQNVYVQNVYKVVDCKIQKLFSRILITHRNNVLLPFTTVFFILGRL